MEGSVQWILSTVVDRYVELSHQEAIEMSQYLQSRAVPEASKDWIFSWAKDAERRGIEQGQRKLVLGQIG